MNSPDAVAQIREAIATAGSDMNIGAGTVTSLERLDQALEAGADAFGVGSPLFRRDRIEAADWPWLQSRCEAFKQLAASPQK